MSSNAPRRRLARDTPSSRFTLALVAVAYLDRICISTAAPAIKGDLGLSDSEMGLVFSAFTFAYAAIRDAERLVRRSLRGAPDAHAHRRVVVGDDRGDRADGRLPLARHGPLAVRDGRSRHVARDRARLRPLAAARGARPRLRSGDHDGRARRRAHPAAGRAAPRRHDVAPHVRDLRRARSRVGGCVVDVVSRRSRRAPCRQRGGASRDRRGGRRAPRARGGAVERDRGQSVAARALRDVRRARSTAGTSTSPGCRPTCCASAASICAKRDSSPRCRCSRSRPACSPAGRRATDWRGAGERAAAGARRASSAFRWRRWRSRPASPRRIRAARRCCWRPRPGWQRSAWRRPGWCRRRSAASTPAW